MTCNIPVLFIIFKRKEISLQSFARIKKVKPTKIYIACDGARPFIKGEIDLVSNTRQAILDQIDWDCEVKTLFQDENLGCATGVYTAIDWLFKHEDTGIILEDDCVVQDSFFPYMEELLTKYKHDERIGMIDGANYIHSVHVPDSYCFSKYKSTNGWGTWKRAWKNMDMNMEWRKTIYMKSIISNMGFRSKDIKYWKYRLKVIDHKQASAWDWQWYFTLAAYNQLSVFPKHSLVTNIGFGEGATHTTEKNIPINYIANKELEFPLSHPKYIVPFELFDNGFYNNNNTLFYNLMKYVPFKIKNFVKKIVR